MSCIWIRLEPPVRARVSGRGDKGLLLRAGRGLVQQHECAVWWLSLQPDVVRQPWLYRRGWNRATRHLGQPPHSRTRHLGKRFICLSQDPWLWQCQAILVTCMTRDSLVVAFRTIPINSRYIHVYNNTSVWRLCPWKYKFLAVKFMIR